MRIHNSKHGNHWLTMPIVTFIFGVVFTFVVFIPGVNKRDVLFVVWSPFFILNGVVLALIIPIYLICKIDDFLKQKK